MVPHLKSLTAAASEASTIVEFGVRGGVSTWALLDGLPEDGLMRSVDIEECSVPLRVSSDPRWAIWVGDDLDPAVLVFLPTQADLVLIDTSHEYAQTVAELALARSLDPDRILCHDADWPGVAQAMAEFCGAYDWQMTSFVEAHDAKGSFSLATLEPR